MTEHRVAQHLGIDAASYDREIRRYIPHYEEMLATVVELLDEALPAQPLVMDLGAGTGALAAAILARLPRARVLLVDLDPAMLEVARARLSAFPGRFEIRTAPFTDPLPEGVDAVDAVVASLALHHVADLADKRELYTQLHDALRPGGLLLSADATVHDHGPEHDHVFRGWAAGMANHGIDAAEAAALFARWAAEDVYQPLEVELELLGTAGFRHPECFWRRGPMTVFGGFRG